MVVDRRGSLRIYLGAAPGVGATSAMLAEGERRSGLGQLVVVGALDHSGDRPLGSMVDLSPRPGAPMRLGDVLGSGADLAVVDDLADPVSSDPADPAGGRWRDVERLLGAGIDVVTTMAITDLESMADIAERAGVAPRPARVPDEVVERAAEVQFVDMTPEALRERFSGGEIVEADELDARTAQRFRFETLAALRELTLYWLAQRIDGNLNAYLDTHDLASTVAPRERVVVAVTGAPGNDHVITRAARLARRSGGDLLGVHVRIAAGRVEAEDRLVDNRRLLEKLGGRWLEVQSDDPAGALVAAARSERATQVVVGASRRSRWHTLVHGSIVHRLARQLDGIDLHVLSSAAELAPPRMVTAVPVRLDRRRVVAAWVVTVTGLLLVTLVGRAGSADSHAGPLLGYLLVVAVASGLGGVAPGIACAVAAFLLGNWFFTPPVGSWAIGQPEDLVVLVVFVAVSSLIALLVSANARRSAEVGRARAEAEMLARSSAALVGEAEPATALVQLLRAVFGLEAVAVLEPSGGGWRVAEAEGSPVPSAPTDGQSVDLEDGRRLVIVGPPLTPDDRRLVTVFAAEIDVALTGRALRGRAEEARTLEKANELRTALLQSVSHDLRTPLTSIKASVTTLLHEELRLDPAQRRELLGTVDEEADRLNRVVGNLLDASRLQVGAIHPTLREVGLEDEVVAAALQAAGVGPEAVVVDLPDDLSAVVADPGLLEQALVNLVANACSWAPEGTPVRIDAAVVGAEVVLRVIDRGPGIPAGERDRVFDPFQRLGDRSSQAGVGLGLAVARGFVEAMGGRLELDDTPGGGATVSIVLPALEPQWAPQ